MKITKTTEYTKGCHETIFICDMNEAAMISSMLAQFHYDRTTPTFARLDIIDSMFNDMKKEG